MATAYYRNSSNNFVQLTADMVGAYPSSGGTVSGRIISPKGQYVHVAGGTSGTAGFVNIATISLASTTYRNIPIRLEVFRRGTTLSTNLYITFSSVNSADPSLSKFLFTGAGSSTDFYMYKKSTSTWNLYIRKTEGYDNIAIAEYATNFSYMGDRITWTNVQASSVPSGATAATYDGEVVVSSSTPSNPSARIWVKV